MIAHIADVVDRVLATMPSALTMVKAHAPPPSPTLGNSRPSMGRLRLPRPWLASDLRVSTSLPAHRAASAKHLIPTHPPFEAHAFHLLLASLCPSLAQKTPNAPAPIQPSRPFPSNTGSSFFAFAELTPSTVAPHASYLQSHEPGKADLLTTGTSLS